MCDSNITVQSSLGVQTQNKVDSWVGYAMKPGQLETEHGRWFSNSLRI